MTAATGLRQVVRARDVPSKPWANGAGTTRELWLESRGDGLFEWRPQPGGPDHGRVLLDLSAGRAGLRALVRHGHTLSIDGESQRLLPLSPVRFAGESVVALSAPTPGLAPNLMVRRGVDVDLTVRGLGAGDSLSSRTPAVVVLTGRLASTAGPAIGPLEAALLDAAAVAADGTDAVVAEVRVGWTRREGPSTAFASDPGEHCSQRLGHAARLQCVDQQPRVARLAS